LIDDINLLMAAGQLNSATVSTIKSAIDSMPSGTPTARNNRVYATLLMVMATPEFLIQK